MFKNISVSTCCLLNQNKFNSKNKKFMRMIIANFYKWKMVSNLYPQKLKKKLKTDY